MSKLNIISGSVCEGVSRWYEYLNQRSQHVNWPVSNLSRAWIKQKAKERVFVPLLLVQRELRYQSSSALAPGLTPTAFLALQPLDSDWNYPTSFPRSPPCRQHIVGLLSLHNYYGSQSLIINIKGFFFFLWRTLMQFQCMI